MTRPCAASDCDRPARVRGCCEQHYRRLLRYDSLDLPKRAPRVCTMEDCETPAVGQGLCMRHYQRKRRARLAAQT